MNSEQVNIHYREELVGIRNFKTKYVAEVKHKGLKDFKVLSSDNMGILKNKVSTHVAKLEERWQKVLLQDGKAASAYEAERITKNAEAALKAVDNLLLYTLDVDDTINWEQLKSKAQFTEPNPSTLLPEKIAKVIPPRQPVLAPPPSPPYYETYQPALGFLDNLVNSRKEAKIQQAKQLFESANRMWANKCEEIDKANNALKEKYQKALHEYEATVNKIKLDNGQAIIAWRKRKEDFYEEQAKANIVVDEMKAKYLAHDAASVVEYCDLVLNNSIYPDSFPKSFDLEYNPESKILIVEYALPSQEQLPTLGEAKFIKGDIKNYPISEAQLLKMFDTTMYNITLRTIHELLEADVANAIDAVSFNGWVNAINRATGKNENNCILSIQVKKEAFMEVDLRHVEPKTCFKNFKGVGSSKLSGLTPVRPILQIDKTDRRFISHYDVADSLDASTNLASMDWGDFEHLIREVFAKEFSSNGGEVKVTQASKDGGVDAVAFDPDPIRGGKIVIQAKRYTNTVGVAAVRDLYGTVMNEGATKGILVTTADYGPDAYDFVKGKPLTLMNGANLLFLLEKHGHHAKIDLKEARLLR
jgi:restriction system protein